MQIEKLELLAKWLAALAKPERLSIVWHLKTFGDASSEVLSKYVTNRKVHPHLAVLLDCKVITRKANGKHRFYSLQQELNASRLLDIEDVVTFATK
jgi:hypothetical protein